MKKRKDELTFLKISVSSWIIFIILLAIASAFFITLSYKTGEIFGIIKIIHVFLFAFVGAWFLAWVKHLAFNNPYLGSIIGILGLIVAIYALSYQYRGPYTTIFTIITSVITLAHIIIYFWKFRNN